MKKTVIPVCIILCVFWGLFAQSSDQKEKKEDPLKNIHLVEKAVPVDNSLKTGFDSIKADVLKSFLGFLSSDLLEGRETGTRGYDIAAEYAASLFSAWGLKPAGDIPQTRFRMSFFGEPPADAPQRTFFQVVPLKEVKGNSTHAAIEIRKGASVARTDFTPEIDYSMRPPHSGSLNAPVVFVGYGITAPEIGYDDYKKLDVKGKFVLMIGDEPGKSNPDSPFQKDKKLKLKYGGSPMMRMRSSGSERFNRIAHAEKLGALGVLLVRNVLEDQDSTQKSLVAPRRNLDEEPVSNRDSKRLSLLSSGERMPWDSLLTVNLTIQMAEAMMEGRNQTLEKLVKQIDSTVKPASFSLDNLRFDLTMKVEEKLTGSMNVLGYIEGSDPKLRDEVVVIGAHLDHLGIYKDDYIFNGADDNGSGSVSVLSLARAFTLNPVKPKRTILFALWTGEEKGLLGSFYYVNHPFFSLKKTVANLNIDMLSRVPTRQSLERMARMMNMDIKGDMFKKIRMDHFLSISYAAEAPFLMEAMKKANESCALDLHFRPSTSASGGSDHAPFGMKKIPWVMYFATMHEDYHRISDSLEKTDPAYMERMNKLLFLTAFYVADKE